MPLHVYLIIDKGNRMAIEIRLKIRIAQTIGIEMTKGPYYKLYIRTVQEYSIMRAREIKCLIKTGTAHISRGTET
jgi:hypothetical protein